MRKLLLLCVALVSALAGAQLPAGFSDTAYRSSLSQPIALAFAPDGRVFVAEKGGSVKILLNGQLLSTFMTLSVTTNSERGLLGIALDPDFNTNHYVFAYYTTGPAAVDAPPTPKNRVSRFVANGNVVQEGSESILIDNIPSDAGNHNAGCVRFGVDKYLYVSTGDGGSDHTTSQNLMSLAGKILRIDRNGAIPNTNPFFGSLTARNEIFAYGLRNPFRFTMRPGTNTLYIGDVGERTWEEVNIGVAGGNYGWNTYEGPTNVPGYISPVIAYQHTDTLSGSITGGSFVIGKRFAPPYNGSYFYADYIRDRMRRAVFNSSHELLSDQDFGPVADAVEILEGPDGALWYCKISAGQVRRISYKTNLSAVSANPTTVTGGTVSTGTVSLDLAAPAAGAVVSLSSSPGATVPATVTIPGGATSANFKITTAARADQAVVTITASRMGITKTADVTVNPSSNDAAFVSQSVPLTMNAGQQYVVSVTMKNTGSSSWSNAAGYRLLSYNPSGTKRWGIDRMYINGGAIVGNGANYAFTGTITAPSTPGTYNFQWRMLLNGTGTFGMPSNNLVITVN